MKPSILLRIALMRQLMRQAMGIHLALTALIVAAGIHQPSIARADSSGVGVVLMHGKGGSPTGYVSALATALEEKGYLIANIEMPWSGRRAYDVDAGAAEREVEAALDALRSKGAKKLFVAGHSQGGLFALYFGGKHEIDGVIAIAPGGDVGNTLYAEKLGQSVERARALLAGGKGDEKATFYDYEGSKGTTPVITTPAAYLSWFDPNGAMNQTTAVKVMNPRVPVLYIAPTGDYPGLRKIKGAMFAALPPNPLSSLVEPDSTHRDAPSASRDEIVRWIADVAGRSSPAHRERSSLSQDVSM